MNLCISKILEIVTMESERLLCWDNSKRCQSCQDQSEIAKWGERSDRHRDRIQHFVVHLTASKAKAVGPEYQLSISWLFKAVFEFSRVFNFSSLNWIEIQNCAFFLSNWVVNKKLTKKIRRNICLIFQLFFTFGFIL